MRIVGWQVGGGLGLVGVSEDGEVTGIDVGCDVADGVGSIEGPVVGFLDGC